MTSRTTAARVETVTTDHGAVPVPSSAQRKPSTTPTIGFNAYTRSPVIGEQAGRVGDRGCEEPELNQEWHDVLDVTVLHVEGGKPEADAEGVTNASSVKPGSQTARPGAA